MTDLTDVPADEMPAIPPDAAKFVAASYLRMADDYPWIALWLNAHGLTMDSPPTEVIRAIGRDWQAWATQPAATDTTQE